MSVFPVFFLTWMYVVWCTYRISWKTESLMDVHRWFREQARQSVASRSRLRYSKALKQERTRKLQKVGAMTRIVDLEISFADLELIHQAVKLEPILS